MTTKVAKYGFVSAILMAAFAFVGSASAMSAADFGPSTLKVGSTGMYVTNMQSALNLASCGGANLTADGSFGPASNAAAKAFQASKGLAADGLVGGMTKAALATCSTTVVDNGNDDNDNGNSDLSGGEGEIADADFVSSYNNEEVGEDTENVKVLGLEIEAGDDSDISLTSVKVSFEEQGAGGSVDFDDYADSVSIWFGSEEVGSADVEDFNEDSDVWSKSISLDGVVIDAEDTEKLYVAVSSVNSIDSADLGSANNDWEATITSIRYEDGDGALTTDTTTGDIGTARSFFFDTALSANDVELSVNDVSGSPEAQSVQVDEDGGEEVVLLIGELEADGDNITITELQADIDAGASFGTIEDIASGFILKIDGEEVATIDSDECADEPACADESTEEYVFDDLEISLDDGDTVEFEVIAVLNEIGTGAYVAGDSLIADVDSANLEAETDSDDLTGGELTGTASGEAQAFYEDGFSATALSSSSASASGNTGEFKFNVDITAFGDADVDLDVSDFNYTISVSPGGAPTIQETLDNEDSNVEENGGTFTWNDETGTVTFTVFITTLAGGDAGLYTVVLDDVAGEEVDKSLSKAIGYSA